MRSSSIKLSVLISYITVIINILIQLLYTPWMIRKIGVSDYGIYSLVLCFLSYFLFDIGISSAISRFVSKYNVEGDVFKLKELYKIVTIVYISIDLLLCLIFAILYPFLPNFFVALTSEEISTLQNVYIIASIFSICNFTLKPLNGIMVAFEYFVPLKLLDLSERIMTIISIVVFLYLGYGIYTLIFINGFVAFVIGLIKMIYLLNKRKLSIGIGTYDMEILKSLFSFSIWVFISNIGDRLKLNLMPFVLGIYCGTTEISKFSLALGIEGFIWTIAIAVNGLFIPKLTNLVGDINVNEKVTRYMVKVGRFQLMVLGYVIMGIICLGKEFISLWVGSKFLDVYYILIFISFFDLFIYSQEIGSSYSFVINKVRYNAYISIVTAFISVILAVFLSKSYGAIGAGFSIFVALFLMVVQYSLFFKYKLHIDIIYYYKKCHCQFFPVFLVLICIFIPLKQFSPTNNYISFGLLSIVYTILFTILMAYSLTPEEKKELLSRIKR